MTESANKSVDDILSSIKQSVEEQAANPGAAEEGAAPAAPSAEHTPEDDLIDINAFAESGEEVAADDDAVEKARANYTGEGGEEEAPSEEPAAEGAAPTEEKPAEEPAAEGDVDVDALMAEAAEGEEPPLVAENLEESPEDAAPAETEEEAIPDIEEDDIDVDALMGEIAEEGGDAADALVEETAEEEAPATEETPAEEPTVEAAPVETHEVEPKVQAKYQLKAAPSPNGLQVGFPVEVLAEALRPMVADWVEENLQEVVERLVKEELAKLADN